jgi:hypothetical protein
MASIAGAGIDAIHVWAYPISGIGGAPIAAPVFVGATTMTLDRPDVAAIFGTPFTRSGFLLNAAGLAAGSYRLAIFAFVHTTQNFDIFRLVDVTVMQQTLIAVDVPSTGSSVGASFTVSGWALDLSAINGTGVDAVHVWAFPVSSAGPPVFLGATTTFTSRPDVGAIFGAHFTPCGFTLTATALTQGTWDIYVFARSALSGQFQVAPPVRVAR